MQLLEDMGASLKAQPCIYTCWCKVGVDTKHTPSLRSIWGLDSPRIITLSKELGQRKLFLLGEMNGREKRSYQIKRPAAGSLRAQRGCLVSSYALVPSPEQKTLTTNQQRVNLNLRAGT